MDTECYFVTVKSICTVQHCTDGVSAFICIEVSNPASYEYNLYLFNLGFYCCSLLCTICIILCAVPCNLNLPQDNNSYCIHVKSSHILDTEL